MSGWFGPLGRRDMVMGECNMDTRDAGSSRRNFLCVPMALAGLTLFGGVSAQASDYVRGATIFSALEIDTRPLADRGLSNYAVRIRAIARPIAVQVFADRLGPSAKGGPKLVLQIRSIQLGSSENGQDFGFGRRMLSRAATDWIEGAGLVIDRSGRVLAEIPIQSHRSASDAPRGDVLALEDERTRQLIGLLAQWVKQQI